MKWKSNFLILCTAVIYAVLIAPVALAAIEQSTETASQSDPPSQLVSGNQNHVAPQQTPQPISYQQIKALKQAGELDAAKSLALTYLQSYPKDADVKLVLGSIYYQQKNYSAAEKVLQDGLKDYPAYLDVRLLLIKTQFALKNYAAASTVIDTGLQLTPGNQALLDDKKNLQILLQQPATSPANANIVVTSKQSPLTIVTYEQIKALKRVGKLEEAKSASLKHLQSYPKDVDVQLLLGSIYYQQKNYSAAEEILQRALKNDPAYLDIRLLLIQTKIGLKNYADAAAIIDAGLQLTPGNQSLQAGRKNVQILQQQAKKGSGEQASIPVSKGTVSGKENSDSSKQPVITLDQLKALKAAGKFEEAKELALVYLQHYPKDADVELLLGTIYFQQQNYLVAEKLLQHALAGYPKYKDVRLQLINVQIANKEYSSALETINGGLAYTPNDIDLLNKKAYIYFLQRNYTQSVVTIKTALLNNSEDENAKNLLKQIGDINPRYTVGPNQIGVYQQLYYVSDVKQYWDFTTLYYSRDTDYGPVIASVNYDQRLGHNAVQGELEAYPLLNKYVYFYLDFAYANNLYIFPRYKTGGEAYFSLPGLFDFSAGDIYRTLDITYFNTYTGSISKTIGNYVFTFRPNYYVPKAGNTSILYTGNIRRYFGSNDHYIGITVGAGKSPDLADLQTVNFIVLDEKLANINYEFPILNHKFVVDLGFGYDRQLFPSGNLRQIIGGTVGLRARF